MVAPDLLEKLRRIQALTTSSNVHEAEVAATKLQEFLLKYNVELSEIEFGPDSRKSSRNYILHKTNLRDSHPARWMRTLLMGIAHGNLCTSVYIPNTPEVWIVGEEHNIQAVEYMYGYLKAEITRLSNVAARKTDDPYAKQGERWKNSFRLGAATAIAHRLREQREHAVQADVKTNALVVIVDQELLEARDQMIPGVTTSTKKNKRPDGLAFNEGIRAGMNVSLEKQLEA